MANLKLLKGKIYEVCKNQLSLSNALGWDKNKIGKILRGKHTLNIEEISAMSKVLKLSPQEQLDIFFPDQRI
jgi:hypothetical protein